MAGPHGNLSDLIRSAAEQWPDAAAIIDSSGTRTWGELDAAVNTGAAELSESGVRRGDRVVVGFSTTAEMALGLLAVARAGAVAVPVDPDWTDPADVAERTDARHQLSSASDSVASVADWWRGRRAPVAATGAGEDLAVLAGAGRRERPVMISHRAILSAVRAIVESGVDLRTEDRGLLAMPLPHLAGFVTAFLPLATAGAAAVVQERGQSVAETIRTHRVTILPGSPMVYHELLSHPGAERALASVRLMTSGAAPLRPTEFAAMRALTGQPVWEGYGITEATCVVATSLLTGQARPGSVGVSVPGMELRIEAESGDSVDYQPPAPTVAEADESADATDDAGPTEPAVLAELVRMRDADQAVGSAGDVGAIALRGPMLFSGYWPDGEGGPDADGWFVTADLGYLDDLGELRLVDRADDLLSVAGFTVYPREIENAINEHPQVAESAVIGAGNQVVALVRPIQGANLVPDELREFLDGRLAVFKIPGVIEEAGKLARTQLGRLDRPAIAREYAAARGLQVSTSAAGPTLSAGVSALAGDLTLDDAPDSDNRAPDGSGQAADADQPGAPVTPERAADLGDLGSRLPHGGREHADDESDDDLFGEDYQ